MELVSELVQELFLSKIFKYFLGFFLLEEGTYPITAFFDYFIYVFLC